MSYELNLTTQRKREKSIYNPVAQPHGSFSPLDYAPTLWLDNDPESMVLVNGEASQWTDKASSRVLTAQSGNIPLNQSPNFKTESLSFKFTRNDSKHFKNTESLDLKELIVVAHSTDTSSAWTNYIGVVTGISQIVLIGSSGKTSFYWEGISPSALLINNVPIAIAGDAYTPMKQGCVLHVKYPSVRTLAGIVVGKDRQESATRTFGGFIGEIIAFDRSLTAQEITGIYDYLNIKWF